MLAKLNELTGKNVLIIDIETNGLPVTKAGFFENMSEAYYDYRDNSKYNSSRIVEIAWSFIEGYDKETIDLENIKTFIRKPVDFKKITNTEFHTITYKKALEEGTVLSKILNKEGLALAIQNADYIIAHNLTFDVFILLNELHRIKFNKSVNQLKKLLTSGKFICTAILGKHICKLETKSEYSKSYKIPKLVEFYKHYYGKNPEKSHRAYDDVKTILEILKIM